MTPSNLAGFVVERLQHGLPAPAAIVAAPTFGFFGVVEDVVFTERAARVDVEQTCCGTETRRRPIGCAALIRRNERAIDLRLLGRIGNWLALGVNAFCPIGLDEFGSRDVGPVGTIENEEVAVTAGLCEQL